MLSPVCMRWCRGLNYSHLLQRRAAVKAGQMLYLVVGQLPATIHKAHKQWPAVIAAWEMTAPARIFRCRFSSVSVTGQSFCGWVGWVIGFHSTVSKKTLRGSVVISSLFFFSFFYLSASPWRARILTALAGEAAAHTDPEGALRVRLESAFCRGREESVVIVKTQASERSPRSVILTRSDTDQNCLSTISFLSPVCSVAEEISTEKTEGTPWFKDSQEFIVWD